MLTHPETVALLDFTGVLLFIPDTDRPAELIRRCRDALVPRSYLALSHPRLDDLPSEVRAEVERVQTGYRRSTEALLTRSKTDIESWFAGTEPVEPGIVSYWDWRPQVPPTPAERRVSSGFVGVGRIR